MLISIGYMCLMLCAPLDWQFTTLKSCLQSKFEAKRLKLAVFRNDRTFWDPKIPYGPISGNKLEICTLPHFRHHYATKTCQISSLLKRSSIVMRPPNFGAPKRVSTPKGGTQKFPIPIGTFAERNWKFVHCNSRDIIKPHKCAEFQFSQSFQF